MTERESMEHMQSPTWWTERSSWILRDPSWYRKIETRVKLEDVYPKLDKVEPKLVDRWQSRVKDANRGFKMAIEG